MTICYALLCLAYYVHQLYSAGGYYNRLSTLLTICYALSGDIIRPNILCALLCLAVLQPTIRCTMPVDITTDYPLCSTCRYYNRLSALLYLSILQLTTRSTDFPRCSVWRHTTTDYPNYRLPALICMAILQTTICCALLYLAMLQGTIHSTDYPL
jgi:hypothetical protein